MTVHTPLAMNCIGRETTVRAHGTKRVRAVIRGFFLLVLAPLPYHPKSVPEAPAGQTGIIVAHRIYSRTPGDGTAAHSRLMADYVALAAKHGAQIVGAFESFFGWTPPYLLQVWRYPGIEQCWASRRAIEADPEGRRLLTGLRDIFPHETVDLNRPATYSRIR